MLPVPRTCARCGLGPCVYEGQTVTVTITGSARPIATHPRSGRFWAWWRTKRIPKWQALEWSEDGRHLSTDGGVAINEIEVSFSHWLPEPPPPTN